MNFRPSASMPPMRRLRSAFSAALVAFLAAAVSAPASAGDVFTTGSTGNNQPINNYQPSLGLNYFLPTTGVFPSENRGGGDGYLGQIRMFAGNFTPGGSVATEGQLLQISQHSALFSLLGTQYGGDGENTFGVPDLTGRASVQHGQGPGLSNWQIGQFRGSATTTLTTDHLAFHHHTFANPNSPTTNTGGNQPFSNFQPTLATNFWIATQGIFPSQNRIGGGTEPFIGQLFQFGGNFAARGFAEANGQLLPISQNQALFSILGTTYGGDGETTFALPDLRGRVAVHPGQAPGSTNVWSLGERAGTESTTLHTDHLPSHSHTLPDLFDGTTSTDNTGIGSPFDNTQPGLGINFIIATQGIFPDEDGNSAGLAPLLGEVSMFAGNFAPRGWAFLDGQLLSIAENTALFSLLGTTYGGDGVNSFALPDLRGRTPVHADGTLVDLGQRFGTEQITLTEANLPGHTHDYIPEPTSAALLGLAGFALLRRRRQP